MATALYLEHYLDSLETLPSELQRNFTLMRQLDMNVRDEIKAIDEVSQNFLRSVRGMAAREKTEILEGIKKRYKKVEELADDKVQLAMQTYEMVDKHIRRLDSDLARFEADLNGNPHMNADGEGLSKKKGRKSLDKSEKKKGRGKRQIDDDDSNKASKKKSKAQVGMSEGILPLPSISLSHASDVLDMPVDPNEPTYCLCHQVSYGEMIGCDNQDCPIEWFHFACVGLSVKPKGKWYCPKCLAERKKK